MKAVQKTQIPHAFADFYGDWKVAEIEHVGRRRFGDHIEQDDKFEIRAAEETRPSSFPEMVIRLAEQKGI